MATNRSPGPTSRLSKVTPVASKFALAVPPVAAAISSLVQRGVTGPIPSPFVSSEVETRPSTSLGTNGVVCKLSQRALAGDEGVVERQLAVTDDLAGFV